MYELNCKILRSLEILFNLGEVIAVKVEVHSVNKIVINVFYGLDKPISRKLYIDLAEKILLKLNPITNEVFEPDKIDEKIAEIFGVKPLTPKEAYRKFLEQLLNTTAKKIWEETESLYASNPRLTEFTKEDRLEER
ncbi:MAG: hypothetical protein DRJ52_08365 [Thermoprotei archaeon]|nr:MAG: hypothetical protein DRJ52_08365 [Thermoprotei archaeon]